MIETVYLFVLNIFVICLAVIGMAVIPFSALFGAIISMTVILAVIIGGVSDMWLLTFSIVTFILSLLGFAIGFNRQ